MSLPTVSKTWQYRINRQITNGASYQATAQAVLLEIKNALTNTGHSTFTTPWTVVCSSNTTAAGSVASPGSPVDRWSTTADITNVQNTGTAHSWILLQSTGVLSTFQILIDCQNNNSFGANTWDRGFQLTISPGGLFTGGTTTTAPTASDGIVLQNPSNSVWQWGTGNTYQKWVHVLGSSDGQEWRIFVFSQNAICSFWGFGKPSQAHSSWATNDKWWASLKGSAAENGTAGVASITNFYSNASILGKLSGTATTFYLTQECINGARLTATALAGNPLGFDGSQVIATMGLYSSTNPVAGRVGIMTDMWWGSEWLGPGVFFPNDNTRQFLTTSLFVVPWNGTSDLNTI